MIEPIDVIVFGWLGAVECHHKNYKVDVSQLAALISSEKPKSVQKKMK